MSHVAYCIKRKRKDEEGRGGKDEEDKRKKKKRNNSYILCARNLNFVLVTTTLVDILGNYYTTIFERRVRTCIRDEYYSEIHFVIVIKNLLLFRISHNFTFIFHGCNSSKLDLVTLNQSRLAALFDEFIN